ncbi:hypothetical protein [Streptomyces cahuitamycinicus]|nr:hypothetical protein [Streptomyces cahuitamycinicus]
MSGLRLVDDREVLWISPAGGKVYGGPRALSAVLMCGRKRWWWLGLFFG